MSLAVYGKGEQTKTIAYRFCEAKELKQGVEGASVPSDAQRLCDASGGVALQISPSTPNKNRNSDKKGIAVFVFLWYNYSVRR